MKFCDQPFSRRYELQENGRLSNTRTFGYDLLITFRSLENQQPYLFLLLHISKLRSQSCFDQIRQCLSDTDVIDSPGGLDA